MYKELETVRKKVITDYLQTLCQHLFGGTGETRKTSISTADLWIEIWTSGLPNTNHKQWWINCDTQSQFLISFPGV